MERIISGEDARRYGWRVRAKFFLHRVLYKHRAYDLIPPGDGPVITVVTYAVRFRRGACWTCWIRPGADALWEKHTPASFNQRLRQLAGLLQE
jgi:hypothetical protein